MATKLTDSIFEVYAEHLLALTREQFNNFRQADMIMMDNMSRTTPPEPMTTFTGHAKGSIAFESQVALNNFKKGTKPDASAYPIFKNDLYYDTFQRSFLAIIKAQELYDVADPDSDADDVDQYEQQLFQEEQCTGYFSSD